MHCKFIKENKTPCKAHAMGNGYCYYHNPSISEEEKRTSQSKGGKFSVYNSRERKSTSFVKINNCEDVTELLIETIDQVRTGDMDIKVANCIGYLSNHLLKAYEVNELEKRIQNLESKF